MLNFQLPRIELVYLTETLGAALSSESTRTDLYHRFGTFGVSVIEDIKKRLVESLADYDENGEDEGFYSNID